MPGREYRIHDGRAPVNQAISLATACLQVRAPEHFRAKHALGLDPGVDTGSREENASKQEIEPRSDSIGTEKALVLNAVAMQVVAVGIEPGLGALDMTADFPDHPPEPRRMIHLDEMRHFMGGEIIQHEGRRQDQPP
jgi:hypothetical protein